MRIEAYTKIQQVYNTTVTNKSQRTATARKSDQLQLSTFGKDSQLAKQAVMTSPDVREDLVASLKERLRDGSYDVSIESFADKLMAKYEEVR